MPESTSLPRVVIVGAGFGGLEAARALRSTPVEVWLVDKNNYHTFQPLLYQVATAALEPDEIAHAVRGIYHGHARFHFRLGTASGIDLERRRVELQDDAPLAYDYLVLAAGTATEDYGIPGVREHALGLKSLVDAMRVRAHVLEQFEAAARDPALVERGWLTFVIVGGGPTGVELAGAFVELFDHVFRKDYPSLDVSRAKVVLVEREPHLLGPYHTSLRRYAKRKLEERGVDVRVSTAVARATDAEVCLADGSSIRTRTLLWTAGVRASPLADRLPCAKARGGRIAVEPDLSLALHPEVFVLGDLAGSVDAQGALLPQLAPVAIQGGRHVARTIARRLAGRAGLPFAYRHAGDMATIGRNAAVAQFAGGIRVRGWFAWHAWLWLHLVALIGFRNRFNVLINWAWNYFTYDRAARLIMHVDGEKRDVVREE